MVRGVRADDRRGSARGCWPADVGRSSEARRPERATRSRSCVTARDPADAAIPAQYDALLEGIGDARVVLLGEATHGTHEFYRERAFITRRLIVEKGFAAVAVEADWPDAYRVNRYVRGSGRRRRRRRGARRLRPLPDLDVAQRRRARLRRLAAHAQRRAAGGRARRLLRPRPVQPARVDAGGARLSRQGRSRRGAARAPPLRLLRSVRRGDAGVRLRRDRSGSIPSCEREVVTQLLELHRQRREYASRDGRVAADEFFFAEQNARLVQERRGVLPHDVQRARRVVEPARPAHGRDAPGAAALSRSHAAGRARRRVGAQLASRRRARDGDGRGRRTERRAARARAVRREGRARRLHDVHRHRDGRVGVGRSGASQARAAGAWPAATSGCSTTRRSRGSCCRCGRDLELASALARLASSARSACSICRRRERASHYFHARLPEQFDFVLHFDETRAVEPLERNALWEAGEVAETFPSGL